MEKVIGCHCHECVPLCKNLSYHTGGRDSPCRLEEMSGLLKKFLWQRTVGGLQLTSSKKLGSSVMQLQRNGFFQQPEWTRKQILPQSSFQMRTQPRQHLNCSLVRPWAENPCEPCTCSSPTETEAIVWIVLSCWVYGDLLYSRKKIYTIPDPFVICKGFVSTFATFSSCPPRHFMPWLRRMVLRSENMRSLAMNSITFLPPSPPNLSISLPILLSFLHPWTSPSNCRWTQSSQVTPGPCYTLSSLSSQLLPLYLLPSLSIKLSSLS